MAITVVQAASNGTNPPLNFVSPVTAGNTVFLVIGAYTSASGSITTSAPKLGGASVTGSVAFFDSGVSNGIMSPLSGVNGVYLGVWMLPNCPGGSTAVDYTVSGQSGITGNVIYEVSGLGSSPVLDKSSSGSNATTTAVDSGASGGITNAAEFILGCAQIFAGSAAGPGGWTIINPAANTWAGYQISTTAGTSYDWAQTGSGSNPWSAAVAAVTAATAPPSGTPASPAPSSGAVAGWVMLPVRGRAGADPGT